MINILIIISLLKRIKFYKSIMTQQVIIDFFERFRNDITESVYAIKGIEDYHKLKTYYDYLDYDRKTIYRDKKDQEPCGLRNIGNTCYLNALLQMLYHLNFLREKIFNSVSKPDSVLHEVKNLFGRMQVGKLAYADPTNLFQALKKTHPDVFIQGVQNDFHEICTLLLDELKESLKQCQSDAKLIDKMLFGKINIRTFHSQGKTSRNTRFNIINLNSSHGNLQQALEEWKNYQIDDYLTENNKHVKASVETEFIETPALMTFFINRVSFKDNQLVKDNRQFKFDEMIYLSKSSSGSKNGIKQLTKSFSTKQGQLQEQKDKLQEWIKTINEKKVYLQHTLKYVVGKQFTNINVPQIDNKFQENSKIKQFLEEQLKQIEIKIDESRKQIVAIQDKIFRMFQQSQTEMYALWGMMIHQGNNPNSGHYKVVLNTQPNQWTQFNDRKISTISQQKIQSYSKKGQICCLLYRRPNLVATSSKVGIPITLKNEVGQIQKGIMREVDKARVLQNLHQLNQSSGYLLEHQIKQRNNNQIQYFFKPLYHCLEAQYNFPQCQGVLIYEKLKQESNIAKLESSFLIQSQLQVPDLNLQIPEQYYKYSEIFKSFIKRQVNIQCIEDAYEWLSQNCNIIVKNITVKKWLDRYLQIIVMKGVFYLCVFYRATITPLIEAKFEKLFKALQGIMKRMNPTSEFTLTYIPIKDEVQRLFRQKCKRIPASKQPTIVLRPLNNATISKLISENQGQTFRDRFSYWISQRENLAFIDQGIIDKQKTKQKQLVIELP